MKKLVLVFCLIFSTASNYGQIVLEQVYDTVTYNDWGTIDGLFYPVKLSPTEVKYAEVDDMTIILYNLNHTIFKVMNIPLAGINDNERVDYISSTLFDNDSSTIEYMVEGWDGGSNYGVWIFREDNTQLFFIADHYMKPGVTLPGLSKAFQTVFYTPQGSKMMLVRSSGSIKVFSLPGVYYEYNALEDFDENFIIEINRLFPNPSDDQFMIHFNIPSDIINPYLYVYSQNGTEISKFELNNSSKEFPLSVEAFTSGMYFVQIKADNGISKTRKLIVP